MKKRFLLSAAIAGLFSVSALSPIAAETVSTETGITFTGDNTDPTSPVDPSNPNNPGTEPGTGMAGPLSLDYVPELGFGSQSIKNQVETYEVENLQPYIQVTDKRGSGAGWKVSASLSTFTNEAGTRSFSGVLNFANGEVVSTTGNPSGAPTTSNVAITSGDAEKKLVGTTAADQGMGTWVTRWFPNAPVSKNDSIKLTVDTRGLAADAYTADLNWIISNAP